MQNINAADGVSGNSVWWVHHVKEKEQCLYFMAIRVFFKSLFFLFILSTLFQ